MNWVTKGFKAGDWVEVKSKEAILASLDERGEQDNMPFMAEMLAHCGKRYRVLSSAHKTCDTINHTGGRRVHEAVHLAELRCDGSAHGGCQANCLLYWKKQWLQPVSADAPQNDEREDRTDDTSESGPEERLRASRKDGDKTIYACQATRLFDASEPLARTQMSQYVADLRSNNFGLRESLTTMLLAAIHNMREIGIGYNLSVRFYEAAHKLLRGFPAPVWRGKIPKGKATPDKRLGLQPGDIVEVRPQDEILPTLSTTGHNRGLSFDAEMVPYCGKQFRVADRVTQIINEKTGEMMHFDNPCIVLDGVVCKGQYSRLRLLCPRRITPYWREIWLRKIE